MQSTIGGLEHGLTPLAEACAAVHVFDQPTEFGGALWLPYRRQREELEAAVRTCTGPIKAVFGHADIVIIPADPPTDLLVEKGSVVCIRTLQCWTNALNWEDQMPVPGPAF